MRTLIIPDVHEQMDLLEQKLEPTFHTYDHIVSLGDWFDTFKDHHQHRACRFIKKYIFDPKFTFLMGNHDAHYRWMNPQFQCSGYNPTTQRIVNKELSQAEWQHFKISTQVGLFLLSHAGYHERTLKYREQEAHAITAADAGGFHPIFGIGQARGGRSAFGGPLWLDWNYEFEPIESVPQIVGHTVQRGLPSRSGNSFCLDTALRDYAIITEDGEDCTLDIQPTGK